MALWLAFALFLQTYASGLPDIHFPYYWGTPFEKVVSNITGREYRSLDGRGNNVANPDWGTQYVPLLRHTMPAAYYQGSEDGLDREYSSLCQTLLNSSYTP